MGVVYYDKNVQAGDGMRIIPYSEADAILHKPEMAKGLEKYIYIWTGFSKPTYRKMKNSNAFSETFIRCADFIQMILQSIILYLWNSLKQRVIYRFGWQ